jgi:hypothetical protein
MSTNRTLSNFALAMMSLPVILAAPLWYLRPDRAWACLICMLALPATWALKMRFKNAEQRRRLSYAMIVSSVVICVPLATSLAAALGLSAPTVYSIGDRLTNVLAGLCIVFLGNQLPKMLTALSDGPRDAATAQAVRRRIGWAHVLAGLAFTVVWLLLPVPLARPIGIAVIVAGIFVPWAVMRFCYMGLAKRPSFSVSRSR